MVHSQKFAFFAAFALLKSSPYVVAHDPRAPEREALDMHVSMPSMTPTPTSVTPINVNLNVSSEHSYFTYPDYGGLMLAHIVLMTVAWVFVLPIGTVLSIARSRNTSIFQFGFLAGHSAGLLLGTVYARKTPDLYEKNSHRTIGWITTCVVIGQGAIGILKQAARTRGNAHGHDMEERTDFMPATTRALEDHQQAEQPYLQTAYRYSNDIGHFSASESSRDDSISSPPNELGQLQRKLRELETTDDSSHAQSSDKLGLLGNAKVEHLTSYIASKISSRTMRSAHIVHNAVDCIVLLIGFIAFVTGVVVYGGVFRGSGVFNGLAHTIKGGIFFWYGLLTLGRWMGCFAEFGWAWNVRPPLGTMASIFINVPSAEFVESFVIFLYGSTNVFLEHLAAWGQAWSAQDLEHVSISIVFFGGGLCGMLVESKRIRDLLNTLILNSPAAHGSHAVRERLREPKAYPLSMNPIPSLVIFLLGLIMSSHHQDSMVATMVHKQWGTLLMGFALARAVTYIITFISPPSSYLPSRPPSELISSFCLISGGIIFMASNRDTVTAMERSGLHATLPFTVTMGFTAFLMAWTMIVLAVKGSALRNSV